MAGNLVGALESLRALQKADDRILAIKDAVAKAIEASDPGARVSHTEYFNHVAVPDLVVKWRQGEPTRCLYLRGNANPFEIRDGLAFIEPHNAIVLPLQPLVDASETRELAQARAELGSMAQSRGTWIVEPGVVDSLGMSRRGKSPSAALMGQALIRGGVGVAEQAESAALVSRVEAGFVGAGELNLEATTDALAAVREVLDGKQAGRMERVLRAVWEGNGGRAIDFPGSDSLGPLSDDDLLYLLESVKDDSDEFWRRIGGAVSATQLARLHVPDFNANLQMLVNSNLERLQIKGFRVLREDVYLGEPEHFPRWRAEGRLSLRGSGWTAHLAPNRADELPAAVEEGAISLDSLRARAGRLSVGVSQLELLTESRTVTYQSNDGESVVTDEEVDRLAEDLRSDGVASAMFSPPPSGLAKADFVKRHVMGQTNATFAAGGILRSGLALLLDVSDAEWSSLLAFLSSGLAHGSLFPSEGFEENSHPDEPPRL